MPSALISAYFVVDASGRSHTTADGDRVPRRSSFLSAPRCASAASSLNFWWSSSRSFLFIVCFPEPLYCRALTQTFETPIEMVPYIAERLPKPFANLPQFQTLEIEQFQRTALHLRQIFKRRQQMREINPCPDFAFNVAVVPVEYRPETQYLYQSRIPGATNVPCDRAPG